MRYKLLKVMNEKGYTQDKLARKLGCTKKTVNLWVNGKWSLSWTPWFYKLNETDENVLCRDCLSEILIQRRIKQAVKDTAKEIFTDLLKEFSSRKSCEVACDIVREMAQNKGVEVE